MNAARVPAAGSLLADAIVRFAGDCKAEKIHRMDLREKAAPSDWFIVCEGDNTVQNHAIADTIIDGLSREFGLRPWHCEGLDEGRWVCIDYVDAMVHILLPELRGFYAIEKLWEEGHPASAEPVYETPGAHRKTSRWL